MSSGGSAIRKDLKKAKRDRQKARKQVAKAEMTMIKGQGPKQLAVTPTLQSEIAQASGPKSFARTKTVAKGYKYPNPYFAGVLDPQHTRPMQYPDRMTVSTAAFKGIINGMVPFAGVSLTTNGNTWTAGNFVGFVRPSIVDTMTWFHYFNIAAFSLSGNLREQSSLYGLFPCTGSIDFDSQEMGNMVVTTEAQYICAPMVATGTGVSECIQLPWAGTCSANGFNFAGYVCNPGSAGKIVVTTDGTDLTGRNLVILQVAENGITSTITVAGGTGSVYTFNLSAADYRVPPGMGLIIYVSGASGFEVGINSISIDIPTFTSSGSCLLWQSTSLPDMATITTLYNQYRVVNLSLLTSFAGNITENGGTIAGYLNRGGYFPTMSGCSTYDEVASTPEAYNGPLQTGNYTFWMPSKVETMDFRPVRTPVDWTHSYICIAGTITTTSNANAIKFCIAANLEATTTKQCIDIRKSRVNPVEITKANAYLKDIPTSMENWWHLKEIGGWLRDRIRDAEDVAKEANSFYNENSDWINPVLKGGLNLIKAL